MSINPIPIRLKFEPSEDNRFHKEDKEAFASAVKIATFLYEGTKDPEKSDEYDEGYEWCGKWITERAMFLKGSYEEAYKSMLAEASFTTLNVLLDKALMDECPFLKKYQFEENGEIVIVNLWEQLDLDVHTELYRRGFMKSRCGFGYFKDLDSYRMYLEKYFNYDLCEAIDQMTDRLKQGTLEDKWKEYLVEATDINNNEECDKHPFTVVEPGSQTYTSEIDKKFSYTSDGWVEVEWDYNKHQWNITK